MTNFVEEELEEDRSLFSFFFLRWVAFTFVRGSRIIREQYFESICQKAKLSGYYICATRSCSVVTRAPLSEIFRRRSPGRREDEHRAAGVVGFLLGPTR